jgi:hypothetical protein
MKQVLLQQFWIGFKICGKKVDAEVLVAYKDI